MTTAYAHNGEVNLRVVVYREGDVYIAQCLEMDIATQARDLDTLLERLDLTIDAECAMSVERNGGPFDGIPPAPNYFHGLWEKRSMSLTHLHFPVHNHLNIQVAYAKAA